MSFGKQCIAAAEVVFSMETINLENAHLKEELTVAIERYRDLYETQFADISSQREEIDLAMKGLSCVVNKLIAR